MPKPVVKARKATRSPVKITGPKRVPGEVLKEERWPDWPFGFKVLVAKRGNMALSSGYLFALRLAQIHHARSPLNPKPSPELLADAEDFGTDFALVMLDLFGGDMDESKPPWRSGKFLKSFADALKDLASIEAMSSDQVERGRVKVLWEYNKLRAWKLVPPTASQVRSKFSPVEDQTTWVRRSMNSFGLHLSDGSNIVSLRKNLRELAGGSGLSDGDWEAEVLKLLPSPLDWDLAHLVEGILWRATPDDIRQPTILNFRHVSKQILDHLGWGGSRRTRKIFEGFFRLLYEHAFDFSSPPVELSDVCGHIPIPAYRRPQTSYMGMTRCGMLSGVSPALLRIFEGQITSCFFDEVRAFLEG